MCQAPAAALLLKLSNGTEVRPGQKVGGAPGGAAQVAQSPSVPAALPPQPTHAALVAALPDAGHNGAGQTSG